MKTIDSGIHASAKRRRHAFTLVELLVVIVVIVVLAAIVVGITRNVKLSAIKVADMNNLRSLAAAAMAAGHENSGRLPQLHSGAQTGNSNQNPYWLTDNDTLEENGIYRDSLYAPSRNITGGAPDYEWWTDFQPRGTPAHYVYFANDAKQGTQPWFMKGTVTPPDRSEYRGTIEYDDIIKDRTKAFARNFSDEVWYPVLWAGICRDYPGSSRVAAVMQNGEALGTNVIYLDGHSEWIPKHEMKARYTSGSSMKLYW